jgi:SAM-dependent methyltransferase
MAGDSAEYTGNIPQYYDRHLGPLLFVDYAADISRRVAAYSPRRVLETAAGTGIVTRQLRNQLPADVRLTATDLNPPMLEIARTKFRPGEQVDFQLADATALPFPDASFDAVVCQFGVMFFPDKARAYTEAHRVLKPGGRFLFNVWDRIEENEFADVVTAALAGVFPTDPPLFMARTPHGHHDAGRIRADLTAAGFAGISVDAVDATSKAASPRHPAVAYCQGTPLRNEIEARDASRLEEATNRATEALAQRFGKGTIEGRIRAFVITAER